jgi:tetratricopeptide (TPR) repeat protein
MIKMMKNKRFSTIAVTKSIFVFAVILVAFWALQVMGSTGLRVRADQLRLGDERQRAERLYKAAIAIDPQNWQAELGLGQVYSHYRFQERDPVKRKALAQEERDIFARAYRHNTKKEEVAYGLGRAEIAAGNRDAGLVYLRQAATYKMFNDFYWRKLGIELRKAGHYQEAMDAFQHALKLNRSNAVVKRNIAWLKDRLADDRDQRKK